MFSLAFSDPELAYGKRRQMKIGTLFVYVPSDAISIIDNKTNKINYIMAQKGNIGTFFR